MGGGKTKIALINSFFLLNMVNNMILINKLLITLVNAGGLYY